MTANELRKKYLEFFKSKGHAIIPSASLIPENDPTSLFTTAGMQPLVPYLMGEKHPMGQMLVDAQKCIRTGDIDEVGDNRHLTFFEMLGNWSLGKYFKREAIEWSWEFLTDKKWLGLDPKRIYVTTFRGENGILPDRESVKIWQKVFERAGIKAEVVGEDCVVKDNVRIIPLGKEDNFWIAAETGPCGPDTEMYYDTRPQDGKISDKFENLVNSFRLIEFWNDVFMEFNKTSQGQYEKLAQQNVDTGMGLERTLTILSGKENVFETELFAPLIEKIEELSGKKYDESDEIKRAMRVIADHIKATTFILGDEKGLTPSNVGAGYVLRRLIRRAVRYGKQLGINEIFTFKIAEEVVKIYQGTYAELRKNREFIINQLVREEEKFHQVIQDGLKKAERIIAEKKPIKPEVFVKIMGLPVQDKESSFRRFYRNKETENNFSGSFSIPVSNEDLLSATITGKEAFDLYQTAGFPIEMIIEIAQEKNLFVDVEDFEVEAKKHQELSRTASAGMFKGGLADASEATVKYHTAAHLMLAALRQVLGEGVTQKGSNITPERLRFDFSWGEKMTPEQIKQVEDIVNAQIQANLPVVCEEMSLEEAKQKGAMGVFESKYGEKVKVYNIGQFSHEICGGPHVERTGVLGKFKIQKEESSSAGVRRIKAVLG